MRDSEESDPGGHPYPDSHAILAGLRGALADATDRVGPGGLLLGIVVLVELLSLAVYFGLTSAQATSARYVLYPFLWIDAGLVAVLYARPPATGRRPRLVAAGVAVAYFLTLADLAGLYALYPGGHGHSHGNGVVVHGLQVTMASPGWGPRIAYATPDFHVAFVPYRVIGYLALAYLLYAALLSAVRAAIPGVVGLASCIGCAFPLVWPALAGSVGGSAALVATISALSVDVSTAMYLLAVVLLSVAPTVSSRTPRA